jgi:hypothetical protein
VHPGSLSCGMRGRVMALHRVRHLMAANGRGWRADYGEFVACAKIFPIGEMRKKCDFLKIMLAL